MKLNFFPTFAYIISFSFVESVQSPDQSSRKMLLESFQPSNNRLWLGGVECTDRKHEQYILNEHKFYFVDGFAVFHSILIFDKLYPNKSVSHYGEIKLTQREISKKQLNENEYYDESTPQRQRVKTRP